VTGDSAVVTLAYDVTDALYADPMLDTSRPPAGYDISEWYCADVSRDPAGPPCLAAAEAAGVHLSLAPP
jgi:hypothetical protein